MRSPRIVTRVAMTAVLAMLLSVGPAAFATDAPEQNRCSANELSEHRRAVKRSLVCEKRRAWGRGMPCPEIQSTCVQQMTGELAELLLGQSSQPSRCQRAVFRKGVGYVARRMRERARNRRVAKRAAAFGWAIERKCTPETASPELDFGGRCRELLVPGEPVPGRALAECLRASIEAIIDDVVPQPLRPNVVLIVTDDQRPETLEFMPQVDRLVDQGVRFDEAFVTTSVCTPSRASIYSGQYAHNHGSRLNHQPFDDRDTLAPWMEEAGYTTGFFGKYRNDTIRGTHVPPGWTEWQSFNDPPGLEMSCPGQGNCFHSYWLNENGQLVFYGDEPANYSTDLLGERVVDFIEENSRVPFFAVYAPAAPHLPATPARRHRGSFAGLEPWRPANWHAGPVELKPSWVSFARRFFGSTSADTDRRRIAEVESLQAVDEAVGDVLDRLEELGVRDNTLVIFTSDHGVHWGEHGWTTKFSAYEPSIRVPMVVSYPKAAPVTQSSEEMVLNIDIAPTIAAAGGAETAPVDGANFLPLLEGAHPWREDFLVENFFDFIVRPHTSVRTRIWKYIETVTPARTFPELYHLPSDPLELNNLAFNLPEVSQLFADRLATLREQ